MQLVHPRRVMLPWSQGYLQNLLLLTSTQEVIIGCIICYEIQNVLLFFDKIRSKLNVATSKS